MNGNWWQKKIQKYKNITENFIPWCDFVEFMALKKSNEKLNGALKCPPMVIYHDLIYFFSYAFISQTNFCHVLLILLYCYCCCCCCESLIVLLFQSPCSMRMYMYLCCVYVQCSFMHLYLFVYLFIGRGVFGGLLYYVIFIMTYDC